LWVKF